MKRSASSSQKGRQKTAHRKAAKSINEIPPPACVSEFNGLIRVVREGRPATIYDQVE